MHSYVLWRMEKERRERESDKCELTIEKKSESLGFVIDENKGESSRSTTSYVVFKLPGELPAYCWTMVD